jgi:hypothetical protein
MGATVDSEPYGNKALKQESDITSNCKNNYQDHNNHITTGPANNKTIPNDSKEKTTFNLSLKTLEELENAWITLRRKLKGKQKITKTLIVEKAIELALADFESKSELSSLYIELKNNNI